MNRTPALLIRGKSHLIDLLAFAACLALPLALLHARAVAEMLIAAVDILFLIRSVLVGDRSWLRQPFAVAAGAWWLWLAVCSALGTGGFALGVLAVRLPLFALALGYWVLAGEDARAERRRRALWLVLAACVAWIVMESWQQYLTGSNLFGQTRWADRALTGPFNKPRAGPALILLLFPVLVPAVSALLARPGRWRRAAGAALAVFAALTMVLIGQRMPTALMALGFAATALLMPRLRLAAAVAALAGAGMVAALPWISPEAYFKLVQQTSEQLSHFAQSDYGLIFVRAVTVFERHPWLGQGFDGFRRGCGDVRTWHGLDGWGIATANQNGGMAACNLHPHNYYLEAVDDAGLPGLVFFCVMVAMSVLKLGRGLTHQAAPLRIGVFVAVLVALWPVASTSAFTSMPNGGWVFLLMGLGFATTPLRARGERRVPRPV